MCAWLHLALFQPEIAQNVGAAVRLAAGLGCPLELVEPFGFVFDRKKLGRAALDYHEKARLRRHAGFEAFDRQRRRERRRLVLLTTRAASPYTSVAFAPGDILLCGRESDGAPTFVHDAADLRVRVPLARDVRSLNVVTALAMVAGEALRQIRPARSRGERG